MENTRVEEKVSENSKRNLRGLVHYKVGRMVILPMLAGSKQTCKSKIHFVKNSGEEVLFLVEHIQTGLPYQSLEDRQLIRHLNLDKKKKYLWASFDTLHIHNRI